MKLLGKIMPMNATSANNQNLSDTPSSIESYFKYMYQCLTLFRTLSPTTFSHTFKQLSPGNPYNVSIVTKLLDKATVPVFHTFRTGKLVLHMPCGEKTCFKGFQPCPTQTGLYNHRGSYKL